MNYSDTFIEVAEDCPARTAETPLSKEPRTAAQIQYQMVGPNPYRYNSDEVLYASNGERRGISREAFFSKGQPCFRSSPLTKRYGWGVHSDSEGRIALYAVESPEYKKLASDPNLSHLKGMRSKRPA